MSRRTITATVQDGYYDLPMVVTFCSDDVRMVSADPDNERRCLVWFANIRNALAFWCSAETMTDAVYRMDVMTVCLSSTHLDAPA